MKRVRVVFAVTGYVSALGWSAGLAGARERQESPQSGEPAAQEILRRADESRGNLAGVEWKVEIDAIEKGRQHLRSLHVRARGYDFLAEFTDPPKIQGNKVLFVQHNMWFSKREVSKPVPISTKQKLVGGAAYGDIAATNYADDYESTRLPDEIVGGEQSYAFDLKAVAKSAAYDRIKYWISKARNVALKAEYYTVSGKLFKEAVFEFQHQVRVGDETRPFISKMTITDSIKEGYVTTLAFSEPTLRHLPDSIFNVNLLMTH